jgi:hypothetical protein
VASELYRGVVFYHLGVDAHKESVDVIVANQDHSTSSD